jgi:acylphosphatase
VARFVRAHLYIYGRVQGVFYRQTAKEVAERHGLSGWVRNLRDGRVEMVVEGPSESVFKMIEWAKQGPPLARVDKVEVFWEEYTGEFTGFETR